VVDNQSGGKFMKRGLISITLAVVFLFAAGFVAPALAGVTVGGYVKLDYITRDKPFDFAGTGGVGSNITFNGAGCCAALFAPQDGTAAAEDNRTTVIMAGESRVKLMMTDVGAPKGAKGRAYISFDFINDSQGTSQQRPRLRQAWAEMAWPNFEIMFGQRYTMFAPYIVESMDFSTGLGLGWAFHRVPQLRATIKIPLGEGTGSVRPLTLPEQEFGTQPMLSMAIAIERPATRVTDQPQLVGNIMYSNGNILGTGVSWGSPVPFFVTINGTIGEGEIGTYTNVPPNHSEEPNYDINGFSIAGMIPLVGSHDGTRAMTLTMHGQWWTGEALGHYLLTAFSTLESDFTGDPTDTNEIEGDGGFVSLAFWPSENFMIQGIYEFSTLDSIVDKSTGQGLANFPDQNEKWFLDLMWVVTPWIWVKFEYGLARTDYENPSPGLDDDGDVQTVHAGIYWFF